MPAHCFSSPLRALAALAMLAGLLAPAQAATVVFSENFGTSGSPGNPAVCDTTLSQGWTLYNEDGRTPDSAPTVNWVTDAWVVSGTSIFEPDNCVAASTSWYAPPGAADDWLVTPAITVPAVHPRLRFRVKAQDADHPDGYEVRWATANNVGALLANPALLTVAAESSTWTAREIDLSALAGQTVYLAVRNNSNDKFILLLDDVQVVSVPQHDAQIAAALRPHASLLRLPVGQALPLQLGASVRNGGAAAITNAVVTARVLLDGAQIHSAQAAAVASLAPGATADVTLPAYTVTAPGTVTVQYSVAIDEADDDAANDAMTSASLAVTSWEMGADDGIRAGMIGIGAATGGQLGTQYTLAQPAWVHAIRYYASGTNADLAGVAVNGEIRAMSAGKPDAVLARTLPHTVPTPPVAGFVDLPLAAPLLLPAGDYYFGLDEPAPPVGQDGNLDLGTSGTLYQAGRNWVRFTPGAANWSLMESFGPQFARATMLRVLLGLPDTQPPVFTSPPAVTPPPPGGTTASARVTVDEPATGYWLLTAADAAAPDAAALLASGATLGLTAGSEALFGLTGLVPGSAYTLHFIARDVAGNTQASVARVSFTAPLDTTGLLLPGGGTAQVTVSDDAGGTCFFSSAQFKHNDITDALPAGVTLAGPLFAFVLDGCGAHATATISITYPQWPNGAQYWKHGPRSNRPTGWYRHPATVSGSTVTFSITNGADGDDDLDADNSRIVDAGGPALVAGPGPVAIPSLSQWGVLLLSALLGLLALRRRV